MSYTRYVQDLNDCFLWYKYVKKHYDDHAVNRVRLDSKNCASFV